MIESMSASAKQLSGAADTGPVGILNLPRTEQATLMVQTQEVKSIELQTGGQVADVELIQGMSCAGM
jgi:hypothetical protein